MQEQKEFSTRNLDLAVVLTTQGIYHNRIDVSYEGGKNNAIGYFIFKDDQTLREVETKFRRRELFVEPQNLFIAIRQLKAEVLNEIRRLKD